MPTPLDKLLLDERGAEMKRSGLGIGLLLWVLLATPALADSWLPPEVRAYASADGAWKLTIYPRELTNQLDYFRDKVDGKPNAGGVPGDSRKSPIGHMQRKQDGQWRTVWKAPLVNDVAPVDAVVSNLGTSVTFDNWHSVGWGDDAVVFYAADGSRLREFGLTAFLPGFYVNALPRSVSSIHWRGEPRIDEGKGQLVLPVVVPVATRQDADEPDERHVDLRFRLSDGSLVPVTGNAWTDALDSAKAADAERRQRKAEARRRFISPLVAPGDGDIRAWHDYLVDAFFRIDPDWEDEYPATKVVPLPDDPKFDMLASYLGDALSDDMNADGVIMVASPSQDVLASALVEQAKRVEPGFLANARVYVAADNLHMPSIRAALARSAAEVIQLDIDTGIPQRKDRLERYLQRDEDEGAGQ